MREMRDTVRQITVGASAVIAAIGSFVGSGAAPGTPAFSIWGVIHLGLIAYAVWQVLPHRSSAERHRRLCHWVATSLILNAVWILIVPLDLPPC